jgi:hypothetical protein
MPPVSGIDDESSPPSVVCWDDVFPLLLEPQAKPPATRAAPRKTKARYCIIVRTFLFPEVAGALLP